jgi:hypothetical protein
MLLSPGVLTLMATALGVLGLTLFAIACWRRDAEEADPPRKP